MQAGALLYAVLWLWVEWGPAIVAQEARENVLDKEASAGADEVLISMIKELDKKVLANMKSMKRQLRLEIRRLKPTVSATETDQSTLREEVKHAREDIQQISREFNAQSTQINAMVDSRFGELHELLVVMGTNLSKAFSDIHNIEVDAEQINRKVDILVNRTADAACGDGVGHDVATSPSDSTTTSMTPTLSGYDVTMSSGGSTTTSITSTLSGDDATTSSSTFTWWELIELEVPRIIKAPRKMKVVEDGIVSFFCEASGHPPPTFHWERDGRVVTRGHRRYHVKSMPNGSVLRIEPVKRTRDNRVFTCVATNELLYEHGKASANASLHVYPSEDDVPSGYPVITKHPSLKSIQKGYLVTLNCAAKAKDMPDLPRIYWLKNDIPVDTADPRIQVHPNGTLSIDSSQETDFGKYECVAENDLGVSYSYAAMLYVKVPRFPPRFSVAPFDWIKIKPSGDVNLTCAAVGSPMPIVKWKLGNQELNDGVENSQVGQSVLMLKTVVKPANYTCVATSQLGIIEATTQVLLTFTSAPRFITAPKSKKVIENGIITFFCQASGHPSPTFHWKRHDGRRVSSTGRYQIESIPNGSMLRIEPVKRKRDNRVFTCVATNEHGEASANASLHVYPTEDEVPLGYPVITDNPRLKSVEKGYPATMNCAAKAYDISDPPRIYWLKNHIPVYRSDSRIQVHPNGTLSIERSRETDFGKYECVAENDLGVSYSYAAYLYVKVRRVPPHFSVAPPDLVEVKPSGDVNLTCVAVGSPMPVVRWKLGNQGLSDGIGKNVLMLKDVLESENYTCVAESELSSIYTVTQVLVTSTDAPMFIDTPRSMKVMENRTVSFFCEVSGHPPPTVLWKHGHRIITSIDRYHIEPMPNGSVLRIETVRKFQDSVASGVFTCFAINKHGHASANASLHVYPTEDDVPSGYPMITENPRSWSVPEEYPVTMNCVAKADDMPDPPTIYWLKDRVPIDTSDPLIQVHSNGTLSIEKSHGSDHGKYECVAENEVGVSYSSAARLHILRARG